MPPPKTISGSQSGKYAALPHPHNCPLPKSKVSGIIYQEDAQSLGSLLNVAVYHKLVKESKRAGNYVRHQLIFGGYLQSEECNQTMGVFLPTTSFRFLFYTRALMSNCLGNRNLQGFSVRKHGLGFWYKKKTVLFFPPGMEGTCNNIFFHLFP